MQYQLFANNDKATTTTVVTNMMSRHCIEHERMDSSESLSSTVALAPLETADSHRMSSSSLQSQSSSSSSSSSKSPYTYAQRPQVSSDDEDDEEEDDHDNQQQPQQQLPCPYEPSDWDSQTPHPSVLRDVLRDIEHRTREYGCHHSKVGDLWNSLGLIRFHMQHNVVAAIKCHTAALAIYRRNPTATSPVQLAVCLSDLAGCYERLHDVKQAMALYREARALLDSTTDCQKSCFHQSINRSIARLERT